MGHSFPSCLYHEPVHYPHKTILHPLHSLIFFTRFYPSLLQGWVGGKPLKKSLFRTPTQPLNEKKRIFLNSYDEELKLNSWFDLNWEHKYQYLLWQSQYCHQHPHLILHLASPNDHHQTHDNPGSGSIQPLVMIMITTILPSHRWWWWWWQSWEWEDLHLPSHPWEPARGKSRLPPDVAKPA